MRARAAPPPRLPRWTLALLALLACGCTQRSAARPFTPELPGAEGDSGDGAIGASAQAHAAAHAAAAVARGAPFWKKDIVLVLTWHAADIGWLAELPLRHVRLRAEPSRCPVHFLRALSWQRVRRCGSPSTLRAT
jgi:hypothetical protein